MPKINTKKMFSSETNFSRNTQQKYPTISVDNKKIVVSWDDKGKTIRYLLTSLLQPLTSQILSHVVCKVTETRSTDDLLFIKIHHKNQAYLALIDSGAQLNVLSKHIFDACNAEILQNGRVMQITGVNGTKSCVSHWVRMPIRLNNHNAVEIDFAVVDIFPPTVILGMPFLKKLEAIIDFRQGIFLSCIGTVPLIRSPMKCLGDVNSTQYSDLMNLELNDLEPEKRIKLLELLQRLPSLWEKNIKGQCNEVQHVIELKTTREIVSKPRGYCKEHANAIEQEVKTMLKDGIIRPSKSAYSSEVVVVKKKTGEYRICIDYRELNRYTIPDRYPLPRINDLLRAVSGASYFVALDLRSGYWQILMNERSIPYTAFRTPQGLYEFLRMPFGLTNAPSTFQRAMDFLLGAFRYNGVVVYLDDILIYGKTFDVCFQRLQMVLERLHQAGFVINLEKCNFFPKEINFLGHTISKGKLYPNPEKVAALNQIHPPRTLTELRSILGIFGYYQMFIPNYAAIVLPLTNALKGLEKKKTPIHWNSEMQHATKSLAEILQKAVLEIPVDGDEYLLETDASDKVVAGVLNVKRNDKWLPIEFTAKKLNGPQLRWPVREKEAFAIIHCLGKFDVFLRTNPFVVHTDHQSLTWLQTAKGGKLARWASRLAEYDMKIFWKKGKDMAHVDFFSRQVEPDVFVENRMIYTIQVKDDPFPSIEDILKEQEKNARPTSRGFVTKNKVTYYRNGIWVPHRFRNQIAAACHLVPPFCHAGTKKTKSTILKVFNWPGLHDDIQKYVRGCLPCQRLRPGLERLQGMFKTHPVPGPFDVLYMDIWKCRFQGEPYTVLTMLDISTRWAVATIIEKETAEVIAEKFICNWVCFYGVPHALVTDNATAFASEVLKIVANQLGITQLRTTPYHPQGNAPVESFHRNLNKRIAWFDTKENTKMSFDLALQQALWAYRIVIHSTTKESPAFLTFGMDLRPPFLNDWRFKDDNSTPDRIQFLNIMREDIQFSAYQQRVNENERLNSKRIAVEVKVNQLVLLRVPPKDRQIACTLNSQALKLVPKWSLPHRVLYVYPGGQRLKLCCLLTKKIRNAHISDVRLVELPLDDTQAVLWDGEVKATLRTMFEEEVRGDILDQFWEELESVREAQNIKVNAGELTG